MSIRALPEKSVVDTECCIEAPASRNMSGPLPTYFIGKVRPPGFTQQNKNGT